MQANTSGIDTYIYTSTANQGSASFTFNITNPGQYRMEARALTASIGQNSFYVGLDLEVANGNNSYAYDAMLSSTSSFEWDNVSLRGPNGLPELDEYDPMLWDLTAGLHTFIFYGREANTWLDQIILRRIQCHKSDLDGDGCVDSTELSAFIDRWKMDNVDVTIRELIEAIGLWKRGCP
jgi:hypothetical protein